MFTRWRRYTRAHWRMILLVLTGAVIVSILMLFRLGSITGGLSDSETKQAVFASSWRNIAENPLNLPLTAVQWLILTVIPHHGNTVTRAASPVLGVLALVAFAYVLRRWYGVRSAIYGTVIFGLSSWFLHVSRFAGVDVLYLWAVPTLLALFIAWDRHHQHKRATLLAAAGLSLLLYVPGMQWFVLAGLLLQPHVLRHSWRSTRTWVWRSALLLVPALIVTPLVLAFVRDSSLVQTWLGLPSHFGSPSEFIRNALHSVSFFVYKGPATPELWLARTPILSFFGVVMALLGVLFYGKHFRAPRTRLLLTFFIIGALLFATGGPLTISALVPIVYLFVAAGFGYLLHEWLQVFPRNPLARSVGFGLLAVAVALTCAYSLKAYFVAWPHNQATQAVFRKHN